MFRAGFTPHLVSGGKLNNGNYQDINAMQPELSDIHLPWQWQKAAAAALTTDGVIMVVGAPDSGKSTFCRSVLELAHVHHKTMAFIDGDLGQSHLGPPTTLGLNFYPPHAPPDCGLQADILYFIGQTSPPGRMLEIVVGLKRLVTAARRRCRSIILNTSGYISGPGALRLKMAKAEALAPQLGIILRRQEEMKTLLPMLSLVCPHTQVLPVSPQARQKSWEERRQYRQLRFAAYFAKARPLQVSLARRGWLGFPWGQGDPLNPEQKQQVEEIAGVGLKHAEQGGGYAYLITAEPLTERSQDQLAAYLAPNRLVLVPWTSLELRLVGLLEERLLTIALGLLLPSEWDRGQITILTPLPPARLQEVRFLRLGRLRLEPSGQELPTL